MASVVGAAAMLAGTARAETWDVDYEGFGSPVPDFPQTSGYNSSTYNSDDKFTAGDLFPGWLTANGNPGGLLGRDFVLAPPPNAITKAGGWTAQWAFIAVNSSMPASETEIVQWSDDVNYTSVRYQAGQVRLVGVQGSTSAIVPVALDTYHEYRLVRGPGSSTVELYIDEEPLPAATLTPDACVLPFCDAGNLNHVYWAPSQVENAYDYFRFHSGSTVPGMPTAVAVAEPDVTEGQTVALDGSLSADHTGLLGSGTNLTYAWSQVGGVSAGALSPSATNDLVTFVAPTIPSGSSVTNDATLTFELTVTDPLTTNDTTTVDVRVFLKGDINRNDTVNAVDLGQARANFGRFLNP